MDGTLVNRRPKIHNILSDVLCKNLAPIWLEGQELATLSCWPAVSPAWLILILIISHRNESSENFNGVKEDRKPQTTITGRRNYLATESTCNPLVPSFKLTMRKITVPAICTIKVQKRASYYLVTKC